MQSLGKFTLYFILLTTPLMGALEVFTDAKKVIMGDTVTLTVRASGSDVAKPILNNICGEKILSSAQGTNIQSINGEFSKSYTFTYTFMPVKDCRIEPIRLMIDGAEEVSDPIDIRVVQMQITKDSPFILEMSSEKQSVYIGEPFKVTLLFKQRRNSDAVDSEFTPPELKNFWIKEEQQGRRFEEGEYTVTRLTYVMAAQKAGMQEISPARMKIATRTGSRDAWGQWFQTLKWRTYFSNTLDIEVKALPDDVNLVGSFAIEAAADTKEIDANEAVNVTLTVRGNGNFEDIGSLKPQIAGVSVYEEEPVIQDYLEQGTYKGAWKQKFAFVGEGSFTVPSFKIRYFDLETQKVKTIATEPINVTVKGAPKVEEKPLVIQRAEAVETPQESSPAPLKVETNAWMFIWGLAVGVALGLMLGLVSWKRLRSRSKTREEHVSVNDQKAVLSLLMRHMDDSEAAEMASQLEANLYEGKGGAIDKKALKTLVKRLEAK